MPSRRAARRARCISARCFSNSDFCELTASGSASEETPVTPALFRKEGNGGNVAMHEKMKSHLSAAPPCCYGQPLTTVESVQDRPACVRLALGASPHAAKKPHLETYRTSVEQAWVSSSALRLRHGTAGKIVKRCTTFEEVGHALVQEQRRSRCCLLPRDTGHAVHDKD